MAQPFGRNDPVDPNRNGEHEDLMARHRSRREVNWTPFSERRSEGRLTYVDDGGTMTIRMQVFGLGEIVFKVEAVYSQLHKEYRWNEQAVLKASLHADSGQPTVPRRA